MSKEIEIKRIAYIKISNLTNGTHHYEFECTASDFSDELIDAERFSEPISITATLTKAMTELIVELSVSTTALFQCDRCLAPISKRLSGDYRILFLHSAEAEKDSDDDVRVLSKNETHIDLTPDVRETLLLAVPMKNVCEHPTCAENGALIKREFTQTQSKHFESEWQQKLAEMSKKFKN